MEQMIKSIVNTIKSKINVSPEVAIVLGSGLSTIAENVANPTTIPFESLEGMPKSSAQGHKNQFVVGQLANKNVIVMQGRLHLYDGLSAKEVCTPEYIFKELGVKTIILTNAAGGVAGDINPGDIMVITDHINNTRQNAMIGGPVIDYGNQFVDMTEPYNKKYIKLVDEISNKLNIPLKYGTYMQFIGPFYETKADIQMAQLLNIGAVGMSTALEVEACNHCGINVLALSLITNKAAGLNKTKLSHEEVLEIGKSSTHKMALLIENFLKSL